MYQLKFGCKRVKAVFICLTNSNISVFFKLNLHFKKVFIYEVSLFWGGGEGLKAHWMLVDVMVLVVMGKMVG